MASGQEHGEPQGGILDQEGAGIRYDRLHRTREGVWDTSSENSQYARTNGSSHSGNKGHWGRRGALKSHKWVTSLRLVIQRLE